MIKKYSNNLCDPYMIRQNEGEFLQRMKLVPEFRREGFFECCLLDSHVFESNRFHKIPNVLLNPPAYNTSWKFDYEHKGNIYEFDSPIFLRKDLSELIEEFIKNPHLSLENLLVKFEKTSSILRKDLEPLTRYIEDPIKELIKCYLEFKIRNHFKITQEFHRFIESDYDYNNYYNFLKRFMLFYFKRFERPYQEIHGKFDYEKDIEEPDVFYPKVKIIFPTDDYRLVLNILKDFLEIQEMTLKERFKSKYLESILEYYKRTVFIFDSEI